MAEGGSLRNDGLFQVAELLCMCTFLHKISVEDEVAVLWQQADELCRGQHGT